MFRRVCLWVVCGALLATGLQASPAAAFGPGAYGLGFFNYGNLFNQGYRIPYYALFPPVYYSYPVARTYGYSPFAYPPGTITPEATAPKAAVYINPYVPQPAKSTAEDKTAAAPARKEPVWEDKVVSAPRVYYNPFVKSPQTASLR
ncbi:MAG: hypothetical protein DWQ37_08615 [Planctomycetota bacterium]|nr:MAG: hypothetical protein DWQ37_08615 [Planctomycetota bacterium]